MKRRLSAVCVAFALAAIVGVFAGAARADNSVVVGMFGCVFNNGGTATVPSGVPIVARIQLAWGTYGSATGFLGKQVTSETITQGGTTTSVDLTKQWVAPTLVPDFRVWGTAVFHDLGTLAAGESILVHPHVFLRAPVADAFPPVPTLGIPPPAGVEFFPAGDVINDDCLISAT